VQADLQSTPISISVMGSSDLENRGVISMADLADGAIPSLRVAPFFSRTSALTVGIRGIVPFDANQPARDAGVGVYIDGVYLGRSQGLGTALFDIERIEVLKGPQGTLFGRNSTGGAVSIVTRKPTGEFGLRQSFGVRNFGGYGSETHLDLPKWGNVSTKIDAVVAKRDGTIRNPLAGEPNFNKYDRRGLSTRFLWEPSDDFDADYTFDVSYDGTTPYYLQLLSLNPGAAPLAPLVQVQSERAKEADIGVPQQISEGHTRGHMLHLTYRMSNDMELRSISSYRDLKQTQFDNGGAHSQRFVPNALFARYSLGEMHQDQRSQEFQLVGSAPTIDYVAGLYHYHESGEDFAWTPNTLRWNATGTAFTRLTTLVEGQQTPFPDRLSTAVANSYAAFGQATWSPQGMNDDLHLTVGGRFTRDKKSGRLLKTQGVDSTATFNFKSSRLDPSFTVAYDLSDDANVYAKWGTAYRAGGANARSLIYRSFNEEEVRTTEVGFKSEFADRKVRVNGAAYETKYKDIQIDFSAVNFVAGRNIGTLETVNAPGTGKIKGVELDLAIAPVEGLRLSAGYAYTETKIPLAPNPFANNALQRVFLVYTPLHAVSGNVDYDVPLGWGNLAFHLDANAASGHRALSSEEPLTQNSLVFNGRITLGDIELSDQAEFSLALWSRNLFDEQHTFVRLGNAGIGGLTGIYNDPRTYGLDATIKF
jgi:iron complex outermembrane recepter protein